MKPPQLPCKNYLRQLSVSGVDFVTLEDASLMEIVHNTVPATAPEPGMLRQVLAHSPQLMVVRHQFKKGWVGAAHAHPHHQLVYVISGSISITTNGQTQTAKAGDSFIVDGGVEHQASALEDSEVLDVFTPIREDYAPKK